MSQAQDNTETGIAVLADVNTTLADTSTWQVNGVALSENSVTMGGSGRRRIWPESTLREAAELLTDRPIVKNFHDLEGNANADDVIGRITNAGYQDGVGIVFEGDISDESIAQKVGNDFLEVSAVPGIGSEQYDERRDAYVVEEISGFRDIAVVPDGADRGNDISIGDRPAMAALSREALARSWDVLQETADDEGGSGETEGGEEESGGDPEANTSPEPKGLRAALERELELTGSTPDRCKTIKDGAQTLDLDSSRAARDTLDMDTTANKGMEMSGHELSSARSILGLDGDDGPSSWTVTRSDRYEDTSLMSALQDESDRTARSGDAVRWESDSGGEREPDEVRYGIVANPLEDDDDGVVLVSVYEPNADMDGWQNRTDEEHRMNVSNLDVVGRDGVASLPPVTQVT